MNMRTGCSTKKRIDLRKAKKPEVEIPDVNDTESGSESSPNTSSKDEVLKKVFLSKKVSCCPLCEGSNSDDDLPMISCDRCDNWFHCFCAGVNSSGPSKESDWFCKRCVKKKREEVRRQKEWENAERILGKQKSNGLDGSYQQPVDFKTSVSWEESRMKMYWWLTIILMVVETADSGSLYACG